ncbi:MAG: hypothetical protein SWJ54_03260 [Cyanobacteriota bacterium]|nr:hypothetical protein [Cyanobacteriota bacterium]
MLQTNLLKIVNINFSKKQALIEYSIILAFLFFGLVGILHHEMWRDEFQAWLLGRDSSSLIELFRNMRYEGHPGLWHLCLYGLSRITHNPFIMQIFHLSISVTIVSLIVKFSPFSLLHKFLLSFGYYFFYEYTIISRNYNLGVLFVVLFCIFYSKSKFKPIILATLLALMANTNVFAFILSIALSFTLIDGFYTQIKANQLHKHKTFVSLLILFSGWGISLLQIITPTVREGNVIRPLAPPGQVESGLNLIKEIQLFCAAFVNIWRSYVPLPAHLNHQFWNTNILTHTPNFPSVAGVSFNLILAMLGSLGLLLIVSKLLSRKRLILTIFLLGTGSIITFNALVFQGVMRHRGHLFILLIACFWMLIKEFIKPKDFIYFQKPEEKLSQKFLTIILSLQLLGGFHAYCVDLFYPFSVGKETAQYIQSQNLDRLTIVGHRYYQTTVLSGYLNKQIYYPEMNQFGSFWTTRLRMKDIKVVEDFIRENPDKTLLVLTYPLPSDPVFSADIQVTELKRFVEPTIEYTEDSLYVYTAEYAKSDF